MSVLGSTWTCLPQELLNEERFHSCVGVTEDERSLPGQILDTLVAMPTLAENTQVEAMKVRSVARFN